MRKKESEMYEKKCIMNKSIYAMFEYKSVTGV